MNMSNIYIPTIDRDRIIKSGVSNKVFKMIEYFANYEGKSNLYGSEPCVAAVYISRRRNNPTFNEYGSRHFVACGFGNMVLEDFIENGMHNITLHLLGDVYICIEFSRNIPYVRYIDANELTGIIA